MGGGAGGADGVGEAVDDASSFLSIDVDEAGML